MITIRNIRTARRWTARTALAALIVPLISMFPARNARAQTVEFRGEAAAALTANNTPSEPVYVSFRYAPEAYLDWSLSGSKSISFELSLDAASTTRFESVDWSTTDADIDAYRVWMRFGTARSETRIGLQKISFGPARLIRPLMWFDRVDPRDPLQITDGVWGLLVRYYFLNNANLWLWGLIGNDEAKGWELIPTTSDDPELGGRAQLPVPRGEIGMSYHHRQADLGALDLPPPLSAEGAAAERRVGIDGRWDIEVGFWLEGTISYLDSDLIQEPYRRLLTVGVDYTFPLGDGLTALGEHFIARSSEDPFGSGSQESDVTGISLTYSHKLHDSFGVIAFYDYGQDQFYGFFDWQRRYDRWSWHVIAFSNPEELSLSFARPENNLLAGEGAQLLVVFNH